MFGSYISGNMTYVQVKKKKEDIQSQIDQSYQWFYMYMHKQYNNSMYLCTIYLNQPENNTNMGSRSIMHVW